MPSQCNGKVASLGDGVGSASMASRRGPDARVSGEALPSTTGISCSSDEERSGVADGIG